MSHNDNEPDLRHVVGRLHQALDELIALCETLSGPQGDKLAAEAHTLRKDIVAFISEKISRHD